jgi:O-antigen/teichoic acid export membrane protein
MYNYYNNIHRRCNVDLTYWALLIMFLVYLLFNIKKVYYALINGFSEYGVPFMVGLITFILIFIAGCIIGVVAPEYGWIPQWAFILFIVGFFVCRFLFGIPK